MLKKKDNIEHKINKFYEFKKKRIMFLFDLKTDNEFKIFLKKYNIVYDYYKSSNLVKINDIKRVIRFTKNIPKKIEFKSLTHYNNNYNNLFFTWLLLSKKPIIFAFSCHIIRHFN